jgi:hypothetical protein
MKPGETVRLDAALKVLNIQEGKELPMCRFRANLVKRTLSVIGLLLSCLATAFFAQAEADDSQPLRLLKGPVRIGPFYPQTANGITWVVEDRLAYHFAVGLVEKDHLLAEYPQLAASWRPLAAATDSSYYAMEWKLSAATVRLRWAAGEQGQVVGILEADRDIQIALLARPAWADFPTIAYRCTSDGLVSASAGDRPGWTLRAMSPAVRRSTAADADALAVALLKDTAPSGAEGPWAGQLFAVAPSAPLRFVAGLDVAGCPALNAAAVDARLAAAERRYATSTTAMPEGQGLEAIRIEMNFSRLYSPVLKTVAHTQSRGWCPPGEIRLFGWDSFFNGLLASYVDPHTARQTIRAILTTATPEGFVPNIASDRSQGRPSNRSEPPVGAMATWKIYRLHPDKEFLAEVYPKLVKWHDWWFAINPATSKPNRDGNCNGLLEWGCDSGQPQDVKFESGIDDSPIFDEMAVDPVTKTMRLDAVDLNALWAMDAEYLGKIAEALSKPEEARRFQREVEAMNRRMNELLWDDQAGMYASRYWEPQLETFRIPPETIPAACWRTPAGEVGVQAAYFKGVRNDNPLAVKVVPCIEISNQGQRVLAKSYGDDKHQISVRWTGILVPEHSGLCSLSLETRGSSRVWLDGKLILDQSQPVMYPHLRTQPMTLEMGKHYQVKVEYHAGDYIGVRMVWFRVLDPAPAPKILSGRFAMTSFYPLISGAPDPARARRMLAILQDDRRFWGEYVVPTISRDDPAFPVQHYWRGKIWGPTNYLVWLGLQRYAEPALLASVADKSESLFLRNWLAERRCHENYLCDGTGSNDPHYTWGALLVLMQIERRQACAGQTRSLE